MILAAVTAALDQATKYWAVSVLDLGSRPPIRLLPVLDLLLAHNQGISYSLFRAEGLAGRLALIAVALVALAIIAVWAFRTPSTLAGCALGLVAGGAIGNVIDRARTGGVIDFLYFHTPFPLGPLSNYVFNLADSAIFIGVLLLLYESFTGKSSAQTGVAAG